MGEREERLARNEATAREINESIEDSKAGADAADVIRMVCECGRLQCDRVLAISIAEYERVRRDSQDFAVVKDHVMPDVEEIVEETDRFVVVHKREGAPAEIAEEQDPRGDS